MELSDLKPIKSESIDLKQFHNRQVPVDKCEIVQVKSKYTPKDEKGEHILQWVLKISSPVLIAIGEGDEKIEFRASELFNLIQDEKGNLIGYPESKDSNLMRFMTDIGAKKPEEILGRTATIKAYDKETEDGTRTYLKFKY